MKFIKKYEGLLKRTDKRVVDSPIIPLVDEIENMLKTLAELQNHKNWHVKRFYSDGYGDVKVKIVYYAYSKNFYRSLDLFIIEIKPWQIYENDIVYQKYYLGVEATDRSGFDNTRGKRLEIEQRIRTFMKKYVDKNNYLFRGGRNEFTVDDLNDIINEFRKITTDLKLELDTNKYNL